jgi:hypothetical protein
MHKQLQPSLQATAVCQQSNNMAKDVRELGGDMEQILVCFATVQSTYQALSTRVGSHLEKRCCVTTENPRCSSAEWAEW